MEDYIAIASQCAEKRYKSYLKNANRLGRIKIFKASDELRDEIKKHGFEVLDTPDGQKLRELS
jgi:cysteinyl-tRNA synthetase